VVPGGFNSTSDQVLKIYFSPIEQHFGHNETKSQETSKTFHSISEARYVPQYVHDGVPNVSHLPAVNYWIQRRTEKKESN